MLREAGPTDVAKRTEPKSRIPEGQYSSLYNDMDPVQPTSHRISTHPFSPSVRPSVHASIQSSKLSYFLPIFVTPPIRVICSSISLLLYSVCLSVFSYLHALKLACSLSCTHYVRTCVHVCLYPYVLLTFITLFPPVQFSALFAFFSSLLSSLFPFLHPSFLLVSVRSSFLLYCLPFFLPSFIFSFLISFFPSLLPSSLPCFLPSFLST